MKVLLNWLSLFTSTGTLLCCALPSLLVGLGMGATMVGLVTTFPFLIKLSQYKAYVFGISGSLLVLSAFMHYRSRLEPCPIDEQKALACDKSRVWSLRLLYLSGLVWCLGAAFAFVIPWLRS